MGDGDDSRGGGGGCGARLSERRASQRKRRKWSPGPEHRSQPPAVVRPILQSELSRDLERLPHPAPAAAAPRRRPDQPRLPRPRVPRRDTSSPTLRGIVAGTPRAPDPDSLHLGGTLLAHHTRPRLRGGSQPFIVCVGAPSPSPGVNAGCPPGPRLSAKEPGRPQLLFPRDLVLQLLPTQCFGLGTGERPGSPGPGPAPPEGSQADWTVGLNPAGVVLRAEAATVLPSQARGLVLAAERTQGPLPWRPAGAESCR